MVKGNNTKKLFISIMMVMFLLGTCGVVDSVNNSEDTITNINDSSLQINTSGMVMVNDSGYVDLTNGSSVIEPKRADKIYTEKQKIPTITIESRPSCGCGYSYRWRTRTFVNFCPHCYKYNTLRNVHKWPARYEQELTCDPRLGGCGADYCGTCGKEKYSWSRVYLRKA